MEEPGAEVILISPEGVTPVMFAEEMCELADDVRRIMRQETAIMEVQHRLAAYASAALTRPEDEVPEASEEYRLRSAALSTVKVRRRR